VRSYGGLVEQLRMQKELVVLQERSLALQKEALAVQKQMERARKSARMAEAKHAEEFWTACTRQRHEEALHFQMRQC
jgi:hypothetical protein